MRFEGDEIIFLLDFYANLYVSIGFGRQMRFSDCVVIAFRGDTAYLTDRHGIGQVSPIIDSQQDVTLTGYNKLSGTHKLVEFRRKLITNDPCDKQLEIEKGYYMQYSFHNDSKTANIGNDLPEHDDDDAKKFRIYLSMTNL